MLMNRGDRQERRQRGVPGVDAAIAQDQHAEPGAGRLFRLHQGRSSGKAAGAGRRLEDQAQLAPTGGLSDASSADGRLAQQRARDLDLGRRGVARDEQLRARAERLARHHDTFAQRIDPGW
jgi:hypothetical protein